MVLGMEFLFPLELPSLLPLLSAFYGYITG